MLTLVTSLWWIAGLSIQGGYGLNVLRYTETVEAVARTSTPNEVLRGLGYWFFYGQDRLGPVDRGGRELHADVRSSSSPATRSSRSRCCPPGSCAGGTASFFVGLLLVGVVIAVGAHPYGSPTPLGPCSRRSRRVRPSGSRCAAPRVQSRWSCSRPAVLLGVGVNAVYRALRATRATGTGEPSVIAVVRADRCRTSPRWSTARSTARTCNAPRTSRSTGTMPRPRSTRGDHDTRVLELPGSDFASYRWGNTVDPITPGTDGPAVRRPRADPVRRRRDRRSPERARPAHPGRRCSTRRASPRSRGAWASATSCCATTSSTSATTSSRRASWHATSPRCPGSATPTAFGDPTASLPTATLGERATLAAPAGEAPPAPVVVYPVDDRRPIVRAESTAPGVDGRR